MGAVLVGVGSVGLALQPTRKANATPKLQVLDADEYAVLCAVAETACPPLGAGAPGATALEVGKQLDELLAGADPDSQKGTKMALRIFDNALSGALGGERLVPFTKLDAEARARVLANWRDSDVGFKRTVYKGLTSAIFAVYWGDPRTWKRIGYDGPPDCVQLRAGYASDLVDLDRLRATPLAKGA